MKNNIVCDIISFDAEKMDDNDENFLKFANNTLQQFDKNPLLKEFKESIKIAHWEGSVYYFSFDPKDSNHVCGFAHIRRNDLDNSIDLLTLLTKNKRVKKSRDVSPLYKNAGTNLINRIVSDYSGGKYMYLYIDEIKKTAEPFYKKMGFYRVPPKPRIISFKKDLVHSGTTGQQIRKKSKKV